MLSIAIYHYFIGENNYLFTLQIDYLDYELTFNWYKKEALLYIIYNIVALNILYIEYTALYILYTMLNYSLHTYISSICSQLQAGF